MRRRPKCLNWVTEKSAAKEACFPSCETQSTQGSEDTLKEASADLKRPYCIMNWLYEEKCRAQLLRKRKFRLKDFSEELAERHCQD